MRSFFEFIGKPFFYFFFSIAKAFLFLSSLKAPSFQKLKLPSLKLEFPSFKFKVSFPRLNLRVSFGKKTTIFFVFLFLIILGGFFLWFFLFKDLPHPNRLIEREQILSTKIYDRNGVLLYKIYQDQNRTFVPLSDIPAFLIEATIAVEDSEFFNHHGLSPKGIARAFFANITSDGKSLYGGSTITQQLVKNALLSAEKTFSRKIKEAVLAIWVEVKFSKNEILQMYFNEVGYGGATYGIEEASQTYFGKSVKNLTLPEASLLAGLPASPTSFSPFGAHPEQAKKRQLKVLSRMREESFISFEEEKETAKKELRFSPQRTDIKAPHFVMYVKDILVEKYGQKLVEQGGLEVITSLDLAIHEKTQKIVENEVKILKSLRISNGAALITNPRTGEILAMVGSHDYFDTESDGNVNVCLSLRQPGSSIKPVNYALALENGFTAATVIPDTPISYDIPGQPIYSPRNYDSRFHGNVSLRTALACSYNVPAVKVLSSMGVSRMIEKGEDMGITSWEDKSRFGLSLTLGGGEVKMTDMAIVFASLANSGKRVDLQPILEVKDGRGKTLEKFNPSLRESKTALRASTAYILTSILSDNQARTPAFGLNSSLVISDHPHVAVKTGTTQNMRDNWTIGYTPDFVVVVWVGNNNNSPMSYVASGVTGASPIWNKTMTFLLESIPDKMFEQPENILRVEICPLTGTLSCTGCGGVWEFFEKGTQPKYHCNPEEIKAIKNPSPTPST